MASWAMLWGMFCGLVIKGMQNKIDAIPKKCVKFKVLCFCKAKTKNEKQ